MWPLIVVLMSAVLIVFAMLCVGAVVVGLVLWVRTRHERRERRDRADGDDDDGGGNLTRRPRTPSSGGDGDLAWWPQFEHDFAEYEARERAGRRRS